MPNGSSVSSQVTTFVDGRHAAQARGLEGRADHDRIAILEEKQGRQAFTAVEVDARQVVEVGGRRGEEAVGRQRREARADGFEAPEVDFEG